jgi:chemotaxis protein MotB
MAERNQLIEEEEGAGWIVTYADMVTLLLVFFVLLFTMSNVEIDRFEEVMQSIQTNLGESGASNSLIEMEHDVQKKIPTDLDTEIDITPPKPQSKETPEEEAADDPLQAVEQQWQALAEQLRTTIADRHLANEVDIETPIEGTIVIQVEGKALFESGSNTLNYEVDKVLDGLVDIFKERYDFDIDIQGHTDNIPIRNGRYESNWELSAMRATTVLRYLSRKGISTKRMTATGFGDSRPIDTNETKEGRSNNRRIEFVLEKNARVSN